MNISNLIKEVILKKELSSLDISFVENEVNKILLKRKVNLEYISDKEAKILIKEIRKSLREYVGRFSVSQKKRLLLLNFGKIDELLKTHSSTKERLTIYPWLKEKIYSLNPNSILDLACGLNPIALTKQNIEYYAFDINKNDLEIVKKFFSLSNIQGKVSSLDLNSLNNKIIQMLPQADIALLFKVLDILDDKNHIISKELIQNLNTHYIIISFSTRTLSGKRMNHPKREWLENILNDLNYNYSIEWKDNEIFYFIKK